MKKNVLLTLIVAIIVSTLALGHSYRQKAAPAPALTPTPVDDVGEVIKEKPPRTLYDIEAAYDGLNTIKAHMDLTFVNDSGDHMKELHFHLYPNIFKNSMAIPFPRADIPLVFPQGFNAGGIDIKKVTQENHVLEFSLYNDGLMLVVTPRDPLEPGDIERIGITFEIKVPKANFRFGYQNFGGGGTTMSLGNWYPVLAVYEKGKWNDNGPQSVGDWTYSDMADYSIRFTVPANYTVAASGVMVEDELQGDSRIFCYEGEKLRDFAAAISNNYNVAQDMYSDIKVYSYFHPEDRDGGFMALSVAKRALDIFSRSFGDYPYPELRIAQANYYCGGMEFPTFIMMNTSKYRNDELYNTSFERSLAHEVAHQWFYSIVGSDQVAEPWVDEGITEFCTLFYFEQRYGAVGKEAYYERYVKNNLNVLRQSPRNMLDPLPKFESRLDYFPVVYINGVMFFEELREVLGEETFMEFLRAYYDNYQYENVNIEGFKRFLQSQEYEDLSEDFYEKWFGALGLTE